MKQTKPQTQTDTGKVSKLHGYLPWLSGLLSALGLAVYFYRFAESKAPGLDELLTYYAVHQQTWSEFWQAMGSGVNFLPCTWFVLVWGAAQLWEPSPFLLRFCSFVFFEIAVFVWPFILKRYTGVLVASILVPAIVGSNLLFPLLVLEGRPYGLYLLVALLAFFTVASLLKNAKPSRRLLAVNALLQGLLPAIHYVGGLYGLVAMAVLAMDDLRLKRWRWRVYVSALAGWLGFALLYMPAFLINQLRTPFGDPFEDLNLLELFEFYRTWLSPPLLVVILAVLCFSVLFRRDTRDRSEAKQAQSIEKGLLLLCLGWMLLPVVICVAGHLGLFNLMSGRYLLPSLIALVAGCGLLWQLFTARCSTTELVGWKSVIVKSWYNGGVVLVLVLLLLPLLRKPTAVVYAFTSGRVPELANWGGPVVTGAGITYFENHYSYGEGNTYYLLANNVFIKDSFTQFNHRLYIITIDEMSQLPRFLFLQSDGERKNFDLQAWANEQGYITKPWPVTHRLIHATVLTKRAN